MSIIEKAVKKVGSPVKAGESVAAADVSSVLEKKSQPKSVPAKSESVVASSEQQSHPAQVQPSEPKHFAELPFEKMAELGMVEPSHPNSAIAEEYRVIKRPLLQNIEGKGAAPIKNSNLIMVTSAVAGEGKTFSAINLAISIAMEKNKTVLFVDADVAKSTAAKVLEIKNNGGLIGLLEDPNKSLSEMLVHTNINNLRILPAGERNKHATELLASDQMCDFVHELANRYPDRVIVFDSPPLLLTTEASVLASHVGQVVFVVAAEQTSQGAVKEAVGLIPKDKAVGLVLNKTRRKIGSQYGYGYGYGYGGYGPDSEVETKQV